MSSFLNMLNPLRLFGGRNRGLELVEPAADVMAAGEPLARGWSADELTAMAAMRADAAAVEQEEARRSRKPEPPPAADEPGPGVIKLVREGGQIVGKASSGALLVDEDGETITFEASELGIAPKAPGKPATSSASTPAVPAVPGPGKPAPESHADETRFQHLLSLTSDGREILADPELYSKSWAAARGVALVDVEDSAPAPVAEGSGEMTTERRRELLAMTEMGCQILQEEDRKNPPPLSAKARRYLAMTSEGAAFLRDRGA